MTSSKANIFSGRWFSSVAVLVCVLCVSACNADGDYTKPSYLKTELSDGPPEYRQGFKDGCESGLAAMEPHFYQSLGFHAFRQDPKLRNNKIYFQIWNDAYIYCLIFTATNSGYKL